jgi:hypothetical protein
VLLAPVLLVAVVFAPAVFAPVVFAAVVFAAGGFGAASDFAALFRDVTAVSRALVAPLIAVSALVSFLAEVDALVATALSLPAAEETRVAALLTVRGVTAAVRAVLDEDRDAGVVRLAAAVAAAVFASADRLPAVRGPALLPDAVRLDAVFAPVLRTLGLLVPVVRGPAGRAVRGPAVLGPAVLGPAVLAAVLLVLAAFGPVLFLAVLFAAVLFVVGPEVFVPAVEPARLGLAVRAEAVVVAALFVGGTDLPPILDQLTGGVIPRRVTSYTSISGKAAGEAGLTVTVRYSRPTGAARRRCVAPPAARHRAPPRLRSGSWSTAPRPAPHCARSPRSGPGSPRGAAR